MFAEDSLKKYAALVFLSSTGEILSGNQEIAVERYMQAGGGFVGIHAATDAEYDWSWYVKMIGASFKSHPANQEATLIINDKNHPSTDSLPATWTRTDEWYNFKNLNPDVKVLISIDEKSYQGGENGDKHPMAWYHNFDGGRVFYTELGHTNESFAEPLYLKHILGGIQYAIGDNTADYSKARSVFAPDESQFTKTDLVKGTFFEPTEISVLPNLDVLVVQRRGEIMLYNNTSKKIKQAGFLNVYWKTNAPGVNSEEGLLGVKADPDFAKNHFVYMFYSVPDSPMNRLSRFTLENDTILNSSEKVILEFYEQRDICCHTGGSIAFGPNKTLFVSTGDNTTPFDEPNQKYVSHGYAPLDDRPGHYQYDERRSSGNTNDLRGKILRIRVKDDGSYEIPEGNLFPKGTPKTRPEIYTMGHRNPWRPSIDTKTGFLYWGEVGPDASNDTKRGPRGYDEFNQAKKAGNFGWPYFIGDNKPYVEFHHEDTSYGAPFDPKKPINKSRNNTGLTELPPSEPAMIWYPYALSDEFPLMGASGRSATGGPVYRKADFPNAKRPYPDYYEGKWLIVEFMRGWIMAVTMDENGNYKSMEKFAPEMNFGSAIDMDFGPDGDLYVLEYGSAWFKGNENAHLVRVEYNAGNRKPLVVVNASKTSGAVPFKTQLLSTGTKDFDGDSLKYEWKVVGGGQTKIYKQKDPVITLATAGNYKATLTVTDHNGAKNSDHVELKAGNEPPTVSIDVAQANKTFYFPGSPIKYAVKVSDKEDGSLANGKILPAQVAVSLDYMPLGYDQIDVAATQRDADMAAFASTGQLLMNKSDCKSCHLPDKRSVGPSYLEIAKRYKGKAGAVESLAQKVIKGGSGVWGEHAMSAHPQLSVADSRAIVEYIMTPGEKKSAFKSASI
jgi:glucose/arabinose dehydrogenase/cytochrome c551/c552